MNRCWLLLFLTTTVGVFAASPYAPRPNDTYWGEQWYLENIDTNGQRLGIDMNVRAAWPISTGQGVTIAIVDDGVELAHPDLAAQGRPELNWNFANNTADGRHLTRSDKHGTPVAGLAVAQRNNGLGIAGVAPDARFASWVIFTTNSAPFVSANQLAAMFRFHSNEVQVQNHSWAKPGSGLISISTVEDEAIADAVAHGRQGKGVVMVRAGGNDRLQGRNVNDDAYLSDPRVIAVAALRPDGIVADYSNPGAAILVSAPGGQDGIETLFTTDRLGSEGYNQISFTNDLANYVFASLGFSGTSAAAPLVSGTAALVLARNPDLGYRDVQQILLLSGEQSNPTDPDIQTNGAGLLVSHNSGFGLVNAGTAVDLAGRWHNRPPLVSTEVSVTEDRPIPDGGLALAVEPQGGGSPNLLVSALPSLGLHVEQTTASVPLVFVGDAGQPLGMDLHGQAALIQRGGASFAQKIQNAADAGAAYAVVFNNVGTNQLQIMGATDYVPIPALFISQQDGERLTNIIDGFGAVARIAWATTEYSFDVSEALLCEHVQVTVQADHEQRGDMRIALISPSGTRSILQRLGTDLSAFPGEWTFTSTHNFYESSQGTWRLVFGDDVLGGTGIVHSATLKITGVAITDEDRDGLDDEWEMTHFHSLAFGPLDDPDGDGYNNAREQVLGTDPQNNERPLALSVTLWNSSNIRLSWPSKPGVLYEVLGGNDATAPFTSLAEVRGEPAETSWVGPLAERTGYYLVREKAQP